MSSPKSRLTRRGFLSAAAVAGAGAALAGCAPPPAPAPAPTTAPEATKAPAAAPTKAPEATKAATTVPPTAAPAQAGCANMTGPRGFGKEVYGKLIPPARKFSPLVTINANLGVREFYKGESAVDNIVSRHMKEHLGLLVEPKWESGSADDDNQKWATAMASGDLPEMMLYLDTRTERWAQLVKADKLADLTDIWAKTASPHNKRAKGYPDSDFFKSVTVNGRILGVPFNQGDGSAANLLWLRKDWLDQVGLKPPTTLDELYAVGRAFMQKGLAKFGLAATGKRGLVAWHATLDPIAGAYGIIPTFWLKDAGGNLVYGSVQPAMAEVLALLRKWYADGFLEPDFPAKAEGDVTKVIASGEVGMYFGYWWEPQYGIDANQKVDPKAQWLFTDVPKGPTGRRGRANGQVVGSACAFLKGIPQIKIEAMFEATNWLMERMAQSVENCD